MLAVLAAWIVPPRLDGARFRTGIAALGTARLGCPVAIAGKVRLRLLPRPSLSAAEVRLCDGSGPAGATLTVETIRLRLDPWPLLLGRFAVTDLVLEHPVLRLPRPAAGTLAILGGPAMHEGFAVQVADGRLALPGLDLRHIEMGLSMRRGVLDAAGQMRFAGHSWRLTLRRGVGAAAALHATLAETGRPGGLTIRFAGQAAAARISGVLTARGAGLRAAEAQLSIARMPDATLQIGLHAARLDLPGLSLAGAARLTLGAASPALAVDLDRLALGGSPDGFAAWRQGAAWLDRSGLARRLAVQVAVADLRLGDVAAGQARAALQPGPDGWRLASAALGLPAGARLEFAALAPPKPASGGARAAAPRGAAWADGTLHLDAPDLPGLLAALHRAELAALAPQAAFLSARLRGTADGWALDGLHGRAGASRLSGSAGLAWASPGLHADLRLDRADLTGALATGLPAGLGAHWPGGVVLHLRVGEAGLGRLQLRDLDLQARAGPAGLALDHLRAALGAARLAAAVQLAPDGAVQALALRLHAAQAGDLRALAPAWFTPAPGFWHAPAAASLTASGPVQALSLRLALTAGGAELDLAPVLDLSRGLSRWRARGTLMLRHPGIGPFLAALGLRSAVAPDWPGAGSLFLAGQIAARPDAVSLAPFQISAGLLHASGTLHLALAGDALPEVTGQIDADSLPVPVLAGDSVLPLALLHGWAAQLAVRVGRVVDGFRPLAEDVSATLRQKDGSLSLDDLHLRLSGGRLTGALRLDGAASPPSAALHLAWQNVALAGPLWSGPLTPGSPLSGEAPLDLLAGTLDGHAVLASAGYSLAAMRAGLTGRVALHAADGAVSGFDLAALGAALAAHPAADPHPLRAALRSGRSDFTRLDGTAQIAHGVVRIEHLAMTGPAGQASLSGTFALLPPLADLALAMQPNGVAAPVIQRLTGAPGAMQRADGLDAALAGK